MLGYLIFSSVSNYILSGDELIGLLNKVSSNNKDRNITGMLIYSEDIIQNKKQGKFIQILEGDVKTIREVYQINISEKYHKLVARVKSGVILDRSFPDWSMGFDSKKLKDNTLDHRYFNFDEPLLDFDKKNEVLSTLGIMKTLYDQQMIRERELSLL